MERYVVFVLWAVLFSAVTPEDLYPRTTKQYRSDYVYNRKTDAFYKLHIESRRRFVIENLCKIEGAELMSPTSDADIVQLHSMFKRYPDLGSFVWVADDNQAHESAEETPIIDLSEQDDTSNYSYRSNCVVVTREGDVVSTACHQSLPFMCKVKASDAPYDPHCGVYAKDYKYFPSVRSCYKIPRIAYTWGESFSECQSEGAHLVVLNSVTEKEVVQNLTNTEERVEGAKTWWFFFAGFRTDQIPGAPANATRVFKTIFNQTLEEAGFSEWSENEPNNGSGGREYCGSIFKNNGKFNDVDCTKEHPFICEKEVKNT